MTEYRAVGNLKVAENLYTFINEQALPGTEVSQEVFWEGFEQLIHDFKPLNKALLAKRETIQNELDTWHKDHHESFDFDEYKAFLKQLHYLEPEVEDFQVTTKNVDDEIATQSGPQLVVPVDNARYALNAANARWGSLYDALYGSDIISEENGCEKGDAYNPLRGYQVIDYSKELLDQVVPLQRGSHKDGVAYQVKDENLVVTLSNGSVRELGEPEKFVGYQGSAEEPTAILFNNNGLHMEIQIDKTHPIGQSDQAGVKDILMESATTTIMDCEDSVAAVDAEDKEKVYSNLLGLMKGTLSETFNKIGKTITRNLNEDRVYKSPKGGEKKLHGRSLLFIRNVGHLMTTDAILDEDGQEVPEGIMDGVITGLIGKHDVLRNGGKQNSSKGSIYIVKPKMHGSEEVAFANSLFDRIEDLLGLDRHTIKIGVMDEERRTTLNLKNCISKVKERIVFINTGFLDRTGDEIHTSMNAGAMIRKANMKGSTWLQAYEQSNVTTGLATGLQGHAQIGKGMWSMPDRLKEMMDQKGGQLLAGANTAWVPSPTAATLHAIHYHTIDVKEVQKTLATNSVDRTDEILQIPIAQNPEWSDEEIKQELDNNAQGILGYVVRWVEQGIGCSKVPDINDVGLMEDRATLRISSQHMANWLHQGVVTEEQVYETLKRMAKVVDKQNEGDPEYVPMSGDYDHSVAFQAACDLVFEGVNQPNGYTEPILHRRRAEAKAKAILKLY
ncbi:malate synthase G [Pontibacillus yanchengensis]|uniref:Malate synthase G n=1 Tax=Pontibacillus yanchengensis TaxID=462910 RepID=A0A6I5A1P4_9BACI|nr:malate synthase G [Pontibacillus yanchengensis]